MMRFTKYRLAFCHIPKTGGTSIAAALGSLCDFGPKKVPRKDTRGWQRLFHYKLMHGTFLPDVNPESWTIAAFTRCPWDRAMSAYSFRRKGPNARRPDDVQDLVETFEEFLTRVLEKEQWNKKGRSQSHFIRQAKVNWLGKFETMDEDFKRLCQEVHIDPIPELPHRNKARRDARDKHTALSNELVAKIWVQDCANLGYEPPPV